MPLLPVKAQSAPPISVDQSAQELLRQQERERQLREQQERTPDVRLEAPAADAALRLPIDERPCFPVRRIELAGEAADRFRWALKAADPSYDPATGGCLGTEGVNTVLKRVQNAIVARGFVTTRVLAAPQDLTGGVLTLTLLPGRIRAIRFVEGTDSRATVWNALPAQPGDLLNLRDIEQGLENFKHVPTAEADIQIAPTEGDDARPGDSDLLIRWVQSRRFRANLSMDDSGSAATGELQAGATLSWDHLLRANDLFYLNLGHDVFNHEGQGTRSWTIHYDAPLGYWLLGATASGYEYHQSVDGDSQSYVYSGSSHNAELRVSRLLFRNATIKSGAYGRGWYRDSDNFIDDTEVLVQRRRMAGWEVGLTHRQFIGAATLDANVAVRHGTGAFDALPAPEEAFGEGTSRSKLITADAQLSVPFQWGKQRLRYTGAWRAQWNRTPLVPQDRFAIGGRYTVRGFDGEASLSGERGWLWRNDLGLTLGGGQELYLGADVGHVSGPSTQRQLGNRLAGAVIGLRGGAGRAYWDLFVGAPIDSPDGFPTAYTTTGFNLSWSY
ncbi:ShlB/FhaC/HecB family hemolysin secretion/activation protein [Pseudoxanthomonas sp. CF125]|uniref:ShlB/FhaC/HecB family hemolysin secretion/activation protein n=1 Tax=Pseudoxanthomonas sp. CF125 TaxID=1855303 RepID=UPI00210070EB|nr:ShlB/FhaC/HecB family hemolysin secretion/activation protein [Pseudoxanthomonas sp. CF125]